MFDSVALRRVVLADTVLEAAGHLAVVLVLMLDPHIVAAFRCMQEEWHGHHSELHESGTIHYLSER